jgi:hypothetical protein
MTVHSTRRPTRRRGSAYMMVLGVSMIVTVLGLSAITISRVRNRTADDTRAWSEAQRLAESGLEHALLAVDTAVRNQGVNWRDGFTHGAIGAEIDFGPGTFKWKLEDTGDNNLGNDPSDDVLVTATGVVDDAVHRLAVTLEPGFIDDGITAVHAGVVATAVSFNDCTVYSDAEIYADGDITAMNSANVFADVETSAGIITGANFFGSQTTGAAARVVSGDPFEHYVGLGTRIDYADLPGGRIDKWVLSPASNPVGTADPNGVYIIDAGANDVEIDNSRIVGTLVILADTVFIYNEVNWEPAHPNYPSLLVDGNARFLGDGGRLMEATQTTNYNPSGTPWKGLTDGDQLDEYPDVIAGLIYVTGEARFISGSYNRIEGTLISGSTVTFEAECSVHFTHRDIYETNAAPGFAETGGPPKVKAGSVVQVVD